MNVKNMLIKSIGTILNRAIEGAAEAVLEEAQDKINEITKRVSSAKKKVKDRRSNKIKEDIVIEVVNTKSH